MEEIGAAVRVRVSIRPSGNGRAPARSCLHVLTAHDNLFFPDFPAAYIALLGAVHHIETLDHISA